MNTFLLKRSPDNPVIYFLKFGKYNQSLHLNPNPILINMVCKIHVYKSIVSLCMKVTFRKENLLSNMLWYPYLDPLLLGMDKIYGIKTDTFIRGHYFLVQVIQSFHLFHILGLTGCHKIYLVLVI